MELTVDGLLELAPVIPVVVVDDAEAAVGLAQALVAGGLPAIEITLRTPDAVATPARNGSGLDCSASSSAGV